VHRKYKAVAASTFDPEWVEIAAWAGKIPPFLTSSTHFVMRMSELQNKFFTSSWMLIVRNDFSRCCS
jgi:hypothetical protein